MKMKLITVAVLALWIGPLKGETIKRLSLPTGRIIGGEDAKPHSARFIVSFQFVLSHFCGGSIIDEEWVLTAAHCVTGSTTFVSVVAGLHRLTDRIRGQSRRIDKIIIHEKYNGNIGPYDIALVHVKQPFQFNSIVGKIELPTTGKIHDGNVTLFGWGRVSNRIGGSPRTLQTVTKPIIEFKECERALGGPGASPLHESNLCTGPLTGGISACSGDSGGPLTKIKEDGGHELVGIVSWGFVPCGAKNSPSVYTRTSAFIEWIEKNRKSI